MAFRCPECGSGGWAPGTRANGEVFRRCKGRRSMPLGASYALVSCTFEWLEKDDAKHGIGIVSPLGRPCALETLQALGGVISETLNEIAIDIDLFRRAPLTSRERFEAFSGIVEKLDHELANLGLLRDQYLTHAHREEAEVEAKSAKAVGS